MYTELKSSPIGRADGEALAELLGCPFMETSVKSFINVEKAFHDVVREIWKNNQVKPEVDDSDPKARGQSARSSHCKHCSFL